MIQHRAGAALAADHADVGGAPSHDTTQAGLVLLVPARDHDRVGVGVDGETLDLGFDLTADDLVREGEAFGRGVVFAVVDHGDAHAEQHAQLAERAADVAASDDQQLGRRLHHFEQDLHNVAGGFHLAPPRELTAVGGEAERGDITVGEGRARRLDHRLLERAGAEPAGAESAGASAIGSHEQLVAGGQRRRGGRDDHGATDEGRTALAGAQDLRGDLGTGERLRHGGASIARGGCRARRSDQERGSQVAQAQTLKRTCRTSPSPTT